MRKSIRVTDQKIAALSGIELELKEAQKELAEQQKKLSRVDKQLVSSVAPAETYKYLNSILRYSGVLKFDLTYAGKREAEGYGYDIYHLKGEGFFSTLFKFIWYLERGPKIFKIRRANFRGVENRELDSTRTNIVVPFEVEFWALYTDVKDVPSIHRSLRDVKFSYVRNPYLPYIYRNLPLNKDGLVEVERARLKGILPGKAFVEDHTGKVHTLEEGAKVYLGFVSKIDHKYNEVYFILNKGGIVHQYKLKLGFD
ncbi:MAG: hypothetical protein ACE5GL_06940 [Calditrichia bacterium]